MSTCYAGRWQDKLLFEKRCGACAIGSAYGRSEWGSCGDCSLEAGLVERNGEVLTRLRTCEAIAQIGGMGVICDVKPALALLPEWRSCMFMECGRCMDDE